VRSSTPLRPRLPPLLSPRWLKTGESICVILGVFLLVYQAFLQWQQLEGFKEQLQLYRTDVMVLRETLARDAARTTDTAVRLGDVLLEHPEIRTALDPADPLNCLPATVQEAYQYLVMNLDLIGSLWGYSQRGAIDAAEWASWERWFQGAVVGSWLFPAVWDRERDYYAPGYREFVDRQLAAVAAERAAMAVPTPPQDLTALAAATARQDPRGTPPEDCATPAPAEAGSRLPEADSGLPLAGG
jgi:hypothetical protein